MRKVVHGLLRRYWVALVIALVAGALLYARVQPRPLRQISLDFFGEIRDMTCSVTGDVIAFHLRDGGLSLYDASSSELITVKGPGGVEQYAFTAAGDLVYVCAPGDHQAKNELFRRDSRTKEVQSLGTCRVSYRV